MGPRVGHENAKKREISYFCSYRTFQLNRYTDSAIQARKLTFNVLYFNKQYLHCAACSTDRRHCKPALRFGSGAIASWSSSCSWRNWFPPVAPPTATTVEPTFPILHQ
jgi:hypothetical protein